MNKYKIIKNKAELTVTSKFRLLNELRSVENITSINYEVSLEKKKKYFIDLNKKVNSIK